MLKSEVHVEVEQVLEDILMQVDAIHDLIAITKTLNVPVGSEIDGLLDDILYTIEQTQSEIMRLEKNAAND